VDVFIKKDAPGLNVYRVCQIIFLTYSMVILFYNIAEKLSIDKEKRHNSTGIFKVLCFRIKTMISFENDSYPSIATYHDADYTIRR
jgi:hypothetical protein